MYYRPNSGTEGRENVDERTSQMVSVHCVPWQIVGFCSEAVSLLELIRTLTF